MFEVALALLLLVPGSKPESKRFVCNVFMNNKALSSLRSSCPVCFRELEAMAMQIPDRYSQVQHVLVE